MSMRDLVDAVVKCVKCGAGYGRCRCWVRLRCIDCGAAKTSERQPEDGAADVVDVMCPPCAAVYEAALAAEVAS